jgi:Flp pilus assembly pilin Flp
MRREKAQNLSEYALILGVVSLALIVMQPYFKRGIQGVIKATADDLGSVATQDYNTTYGKNIDAQNLGKASSGLVSYTAQKPLTIEAEKKITKIESATPGSDLSRTTKIDKDISTTSGKWTTTAVSYNPAEDSSKTTTPGSSSGTTNTGGPAAGGAKP